MPPLPLRGGHFRRLRPPAGDEDHPVDRLVAALPEVRAVDRRARRIAGRLGADARARANAAAWIRYDDLRLLQRTVRQEAYFDAGWELGSVAGAAASLGREAGGSAAQRDAALADELGLAVTRLAVTTPLDRDHAAAVLLEIARALILGLGRTTKPE
jgi:hypothetical protein